MKRGLVAIALVAACTGGDDIHTPVIGGIQPDRGAAGTTVTVSGSFFCAQPEPTDETDPLACTHMGTITFGGAPAVVGQYTDTSILAEVPAVPAGEVGVRLSVAGRTSNSLAFTVE